MGAVKTPLCWSRPARFDGLPLLGRRPRRRLFLPPPPPEGRPGPAFIFFLFKSYIVARRETYYFATHRCWVSTLRGAEARNVQKNPFQLQLLMIFSSKRLEPRGAGASQGAWPL